MKKSLFFCILLTVVGCIALFSCKKEGSIDPQKFTVTAIVKNGIGGEITPSVVEVTLGSGATFNFHEAPGYKKPESILVNGNKVLLSSSNYTLSKVETNSTIEAEFPITPLGILMQKPWKLVKNEKRNIGEEWNNDPLRDEEIITFGANSKYQLKSKGVLVGDGVYSLSYDNMSLTIGGSDYKIVVLSQDTLEVTYRIRYIANGVYDPTKDLEGKDTYTH